jgi:hypothetical protein
MTDREDSFRDVIVALTAEAEELERRAGRLREMARELQDVARSSSGATGALMVQPLRFATPTTNRVATASTLNFSDAKPGRPRISTSRLVLDAIAATPGIKFDELCDRVIPRIESAAHNKRKLVHSTVDYLRKQQKLVFRADGSLLLPAREDPR